jgi:XTP/dITP diphosphohydrolase
MAKSLLFASSNQHKLDEIKVMIPGDYEVKNLRDIGWTKDIPEPFETFEENAATKVSTLYAATGLMCFAEDSGIVINALDGRPGVYSARYSGTHGDIDQNNQKVLREMLNVKDRSASFVSVIAFQVGENEIHYFKGRIEGSISQSVIGKEGFGYDPIFIPNGFDQTFGVLSSSLKNRISHRSRSMEQFIDFLRRY